MTELLSITIEKIRPLDAGTMLAAMERQDTLTKPQGSLGRLEKLSVQIAGIQGKAIPQIKEKAIITMAADHGVVKEGIGNWPQEVTAQMVENFLRGGAGINVIGRQAGVRLVIVDMGVAGEIKNRRGLVSCKIAPGTASIIRGPAMTGEQAVQSVEAGIRIINEEIDRGLDIVGTGDMGIGNTTASSAICAVFTGKPPEEVTGRGTGISDEQLERKVAIVKKAIEVNRPDPEVPLDVLAKVGGFEIGGLAGVMLGAAARRIPVVVDGFISGAAALVAVALAPKLMGYLIGGHLSAEGGHRIMVNHLGFIPLLDLEMRLGEGTGAALGIFLCETACKVLAEMSTFAEAGVSEESEAES
jgi:nicotinate-nucleotide--dimethylbenzimidazole phosphoribosyltransferase